MKNVLRYCSRIADAVATTANAAGTLVVLVLVAVINFDIVARNAFDTPFLGAVEVVQFSMVLIVFLQLPDVVRVDKLTRSDGFLAIAGKRWPGFSRLIGYFIDGLSCLFMLAIAIAIWPEFIEMLETGDYFGVPHVFTAPWWPVKLAIFISAALCSLIFAFRVLFPHRPGDMLKQD